MKELPIYPVQLRFDLNVPYMGEIKKTSVTGEINRYLELSNTEKISYSKITKTYKWISAILLNGGAYMATSKINTSELNSPEVLGSIAISTIGFFGYYYSVIRRSVQSIFKEE